MSSFDMEMELIEAVKSIAQSQESIAEALHSVVDLLSEGAEQAKQTTEMLKWLAAKKDPL